MLPKFTVGAALFAAVSNAASGSPDAIYSGKNAEDAEASLWSTVAKSPTNSSSATFSGWDLTKKFPSSAQDGWKLTVDVKTNFTYKGEDGELTATTMSIAKPDSGDSKVDDSWQMCLHVFNVHPASASDGGGWGSGLKDSCDGLVLKACVEDLQKNAVKNYGSGCPTYKTTASCLRDLDKQSSVSLGVSAMEANTLFTNNDTFFRSLDGDDSAFADAAALPRIVIAVFGSTADGSADPETVPVCVQPKAKKAAASTSAVALSAWAVVAAVTAFQLFW